MSHKVSYKWIRKTQVIPEYVVFYKNWEDCGGCLTVKNVGILLGGCLTCEELVGVTYRR